MVRARSVILATLLAAVPAAAADKTAPEQHPAHQHGAASLQVSLDGRALQISLEGPSDNLLGFEHAPQNEAEKQAVTRAEQESAYSLLRERGLIRIGLDVPAGAEFAIDSVVDPYACPPPTNDVSFYRRPPPAANVSFLSAVLTRSR